MMKTKLMLGIVFLMFFLVVPMVSSAQESLGVFITGENITLKQTCADCTYNNITSVVLSSVNTTELIGVVEMEQVGSKEWRYNLSSNYTTNLGTYTVNGIGNPGGTDTIWVYDFKITYTGKELSTASSVFYIILFVLLILMFVLTIYFINKLPGKNERNEEGMIIRISYLKYLRSTLWFILWMFIIAIEFIAFNLGFAYLDETLFAEFMFMLFRISLGITPIIIIIWFIWIFAQIFDDRKLRSLWERGVFPNEYRI